MNINRLPVPILAELGPQHSEALTALDRTMFAGFHEVSDDFYNGLFRDGARIVGHQVEGTIVSVAALFPQPLSDPDVPKLERQLPSWAGFLDGAAVSPQYRRSQRPDLDLHGELLDWRINTARDLGKMAALCVVRADNRPSDSNLRRKGFHALVDAPGYYGPRTEDNRIAGAVLLDNVNAIAWPHPSDPTPLDEVKDVLKEQPAIVTLPLPTGLDPQYRQAVSNLLQSGYLSFAYPQHIAANTIPFVHLETTHALPEHTKSQLLMIRRVLQQFCSQ